MRSTVQTRATRQSRTGFSIALLTMASMFAAAPAPAQSTPDAPATDLLLVNGRIHTPTGTAGAMLVRDGRIVAIDSEARLRRSTARTPRVVDLRGRSVMPGFYDMHVHPMMAYNGEEGSCRIEQGATAERLLSVVAECVSERKPGEWVTGAQWQAISMGDTPITRQTLDRVSPANPVMLFDISGHALWVNSKALEVIGVTRDTPDPEGGIIERAPDGTPSGVLRETARDLILSRLPPPTPEQNVQALKKGLDMLASRGVVALLDAMVLRDGIAAYTELADRGQLKQTVVGCIAYSHAGKPMPYFDEVIAKRDKYARPRFHPSCVKVFVDGVPTEGRTAAMLAPYAGGDPKAPPQGMLLVEPKVLNAAVARWDAMGLTALFHAAGDGAVHASLNSIEYARRVNGPHGQRHQVGHATFIAREDFPRVKPLNATIEFSPYLWYPGPINDDIIKAIGPERIARVWPLREGFDSGGLVVAGSDWAVVPDPNPWLAIETAITRRAPGGGDTAYGPAEAITLREAIAMFTVNAAKQFGIEGGTLEAGKPADFIVIDRDPFAVPVTQLHTLKVEATYIAGEAVWESSGRATP